MKTNKVFLSLLVVAGLTGALIVSIYGIRFLTNVNKKASSIYGNSTITLSPASGNYLPGEVNSITISANIPSTSNIDGIQVVATVSGIASDLLSFSPNIPTNMTMVYNSITPGVSSPSSVLKFVYVTSSPSASVQGNIFNLGSLVFDSKKVNKNVTVSFDTQLTKIAQNSTTNDILLPPQSESYVFAYPPTSTPTNTTPPDPTTTAKPIPTPVASYSPSPTPIPVGKVSIISLLNTGHKGKKYSGTIKITDTISEPIQIGVSDFPPGINTVKCTNVAVKYGIAWDCVLTGKPTVGGDYFVQVVVNQINTNTKTVQKLVLPVLPKRRK